MQMLATLLRPGRGTKRRLGAATLAVAGALALIATWTLSRYGVRYGVEVAGLSLSIAAGQAECSIWWTTKPQVFSSYDVGWSGERTPPDPASGWMGRAIGGRWRWLMPEGGNEVIPPHAHRVWAIPGFVEYECDTGLWADGGAARSLSVMLWPIAPLCWLAAWPLAVAGRRARRRSEGACPRCGHRLAAGQERCPECGGERR